jgi:hypothetical protein
MKIYENFLLDIGKYAVLIQKYFWIFGIPYIVISPFFFISILKSDAPPPPQIMPVLTLNTDGVINKLICNTKTDGDEILLLAKELSKKMVVTFYAWPQSKGQASARMASFAKYFNQNKNSEAQNFLSMQTTKILSEVNTSQASFEILKLEAEYDLENNEFVVVLDGVQSTLRNDIKTSQNISLDIYFKYANENRKKYNDILIEITKIMDRKNAKI